MNLFTLQVQMHASHLASAFLKELSPNSFARLVQVFSQQVSCPQCRGSGVILFKSGPSSTSTAVCVHCEGEGTLSKFLELQHDNSMRLHGALSKKLELGQESQPEPQAKPTS